MSSNCFNNYCFICIINCIGQLCVLHHKGYSNTLELFCFIQEAVKKNVRIIFRNSKSLQGVENKVSC